MIRFIHISETHIGPTKDFQLQSVTTYPCAEKLISYLNGIKDKPDFILHTGDVADKILEGASYDNVLKVLGKLKYLVYYVTGNHDDSPLIKQYLEMGERKPLVTDKSKNSYYFDIQDYRFIILDGRGPDRIDPHGTLSADQFEALEKELKEGKKQLIISIHFPLFPLDSKWLNENMLLLEGERLHRLLAKHADRILSVFFGHIHRGMQIVKDGVLYSSVASPCVQFQWYPSQSKPVFESTGQAYFNYVTVDDKHVTIKEYSIPNGENVFVRD